ncbi:hypothetical protein [Rufibacter roseus]|uniref:Uncharacterized protein n=1 Tax=Rufibacter roseus TaxID=1567108 RepID=A0ABW2DMM6_9BACT|nr:hypothetical protein [Rufibacter roseus]
MKPKIKFSSFKEQDDKREYWQSKSYEERLAEAFRLNKKAYWEYYSQPNPQMSKRTRLFIKREDESLEEFFARKNAAK